MKTRLYLHCLTFFELLLIYYKVIIIQVQWVPPYIVDTIQTVVEELSSFS